MTTTTTSGRVDTSLTYVERTLISGEFGAGLRLGFDTTSGRDINVMSARAINRMFRRRFGYAGSADMLTLPEAQAKLGKSVRYALGLMLSPANSTPEEVTRIADIRARFTLCASASSGCRAACLGYSGHGAFTNTQRARQVRTAFLLAHPHAAGVLIGRETRVALDEHGPDNLTLRLNVLSDIRWEYVAPVTLSYMELSGVRLYDYTAHAPAKRDAARIPGYCLTYSAKEVAHTSDDYLAGILLSGGNVAMPFHVVKGKPLPTHYVLAGRSFTVIDGDLTDDRTTDPRGTVGVIVGLRAKGQLGKADTSGFIRLVPVSA